MATPTPEPAPNASPLPYAASGWYFPYHDATGASDTFEYVTLEDNDAWTVSGADAVVATGTSSGLAADTPYYRLEIANLMKDGDFEESTLGTAGAPRFGSSDASVSTEIVGIASTSAVHGQSFYIARQSTQWASMAISEFLLNSSSDPAIYQFNFLFKNSGGNNKFQYSYSNPEDANNADILVSGITEIRTQSGDTQAGSSGSNLLYLGGSLPQAGSVDDIRATRRGIDLGIRMDVSPTLEYTEERPGVVLISGRYRFSVWVKDDLAAEDLYSSVAADPYRARAISLAIRANNYPGTDGGVEALIPTPAGGYPTWTKISAVIPAGQTIQLDAEREFPVMSLHVYATNIIDGDGQDPGSILIAQPELNYLAE